LGRLRGAFNRLGAVVKQARVAAVVVVIPWLQGEPSTYAFRAAHAIVAHEAERQGFSVLDMLDDFLAAGVTRLRLATNDPIHPNRAGHEMIAARLAERLTEPDMSGPGEASHK
jgi:lysophospholipase L1-like esterase